MPVGNESLKRDIKIEANQNTIINYVDKIDDETNGLTAIKAEVEGIGGAAMRGTDNAALAATALSDATWTNARAGYLDNINNVNLATIADISTLTATEIGYIDASIAGVETKVDTAITDIGTVDGVVDAIKLKSDLMNSATGTATLNDANPSDTIVPTSLPTKIHVIFDISTIIVAADDFTLEVKVGVAASERVVAYYNITSDGTDTTIDTGSGTGTVVKQRRIDISDIMVYTGEQVLLNYTKNSVTDRNVVYKYVCGV